MHSITREQNEGSDVRGETQQTLQSWLRAFLIALCVCGALANAAVWSLVLLRNSDSIAMRVWFKEAKLIQRTDGGVPKEEPAAASSSVIVKGTLVKKPLLTLAVLDVGQGDAIYIESPAGNQMLIDGGPDAAVLGQLERIMPPQDKDIDVLLISNPDKDHIAGFIDILSRYTVGLLVEPGTINKSNTFAHLKKVATTQNVPFMRGRRGMDFDLGGGVHFQILYPQGDVTDISTNQGSIVGVLSYASTTALLTGDSTVASEKVFLKNHPALDVDLLKVGHHGSYTSTSEALLRQVTPAVALISAGKDNKYKHPHDSILKRLESLHIPYEITAREGVIIYVSDGERFYKVERGD